MAQMACPLPTGLGGASASSGQWPWVTHLEAQAEEYPSRTEQWPWVPHLEAQAEEYAGKTEHPQSPTGLGGASASSEQWPWVPHLEAQTEEYAGKTEQWPWVPHLEAEGYTGAAEQVCPDIDISAELSRLAREGLALVEKLTLAADCLRLQLAIVRDTLCYFLYTEQPLSWQATTLPFTLSGLASDYLGVYLECNAAQSVKQIHEWLCQQADQEAPPLPAEAVEGMKLLEHHVTDFAVLLCSRSTSQMMMKGKGIPPELLSRLERAFGQAALQDDKIWPKLGSSKYHVFTPLMRFGERKHRHGRSGRKSRLPKPEAADDEAEESPSFRIYISL